MSRLNIKDKFKFLTLASLNIENMSTSLDQYLSQFFKETKTYYSRKNIYGQLLQFVKDLSQLIFYYIKKSSTENNIITAQKDVSLQHFAELSGYNPVRYISSTGNIRMHFFPNASQDLGNTVLIRKYAKIRCKNNGLIYLVNINDEHKKTSLLKSDLILPVIEGDIKEQTFYSDGSKYFTINLEENDNIENSNIKVFVDNEEWDRYYGLTEMISNSKGYILKTGYTNAIDIIFGNDINGVIPQRGSEIKIEYIISHGENGNLDSDLYIEFEPISGFYDSKSEEIQMTEYSKCEMESGFLNGSYGDSKDTLREIIGFNDRTMVLADSKNYEAFLGRYSTISRVHVWSPYDNPNIKQFLIFPNMFNKMESNKDYLTIDIDKFFISNRQKDSIINAIKDSGKSYQNHELRFIDPVIRKYATIIYIDYGDEILSEIKTKVEDCIITIFVENTFKKFSKKVNLDIVKADFIKSIREALPKANSISLNIISSENEEAKLQGWYYNYINTLNKNIISDTSVKKIKVNVGDDPHIGLSDNNDIISERLDIVPILRGGFKIQSYDENNNLLSYDNAIKIENPIIIHVKTSNGWELLK